MRSQTLRLLRVDHDRHDADITGVEGDVALVEASAAQYGLSNLCERPRVVIQARTMEGHAVGLCRKRDVDFDLLAEGRLVQMRERVLTNLAAIGRLSCRRYASQPASQRIISPVLAIPHPLSGSSRRYCTPRHCQWEGNYHTCLSGQMQWFATRCNRHGITLHGHIMSNTLGRAR